jgi:hypothetical protein
MKRFDEIRDIIMSLEGDFEKFYEKGNQAAGTRIRQGMQKLKALAHEIRAEVQEKKNNEVKSNDGEQVEKKEKAK